MCGLVSLHVGQMGHTQKKKKTYKQKNMMTCRVAAQLQTRFKEQGTAPVQSWRAAPRWWRGSGPGWGSCSAAGWTPCCSAPGWASWGDRTGQQILPRGSQYLYPLVEELAGEGDLISQLSRDQQQSEHQPGLSLGSLAALVFPGGFGGSQLGRGLPVLPHVALFSSNRTVAQ